MQIFILLIVVLVASFGYQALFGEGGAKECGQFDEECLAEEYLPKVNVSCVAPILERAKYDHDWTSSTKFDRYQWSPDADGERVMRFHGAALKLQNGFGAWAPQKYWCDYDLNRERVRKVDVY